MPDEIRFQYLKGAIGREYSLGKKEAEIAFQYLKGAIGRRACCPPASRTGRISIPQRCDWKLNVIWLTRNSATISIPQRCDWKGSTRGCISSALCYFNTSKVRLEGARTGMFCSATSSDFNTSKVRLEVARGMGPVCARKIFQYLKGAIGSPDSHGAGDPFADISIPQRCDWK